MIKAVLLDFDGTLVTEDMLDVVCEIVGKRKESKRINAEFHTGIRIGLEGLIDRINLLKGVNVAEIKDKIAENPYLMPGAIELIHSLNSNNIISILNSGNIMTVLTAYKELFGITHVVGTKPVMDGETIMGISEEQFTSKNYKIDGIKEILAKYNIDAIDTLAIGDSPADKNVFVFAGKSIAIDPKGNIADYADYVIDSDLSEAINIIESINNA